MNSFTKKSLQSLLFSGYLPGPKETTKEFFFRVRKTKRLFKKTDPFSSLFSDKTYLTAKDNHYFFLNISKKKIPFYIAGYTHIFEKDGCKIGCIQIHPRFYKKEEFLDHELIHLKRLCYEEPIFEEILAFKTSKNWRKHWGNLLTNKSLKIFLGSYFFSIFCYLNWSSFFLFLPCAVLAFCTRTLSKKQKTYTTVFNKLKAISPFPDSLSLLLTDKEYFLFEQLSTTDIISYMRNEISIRKQAMLALLNE